MKASSIGGNIAENAGGPHCFKYGVTTNHVLGLEVVLPDGEVVWLGGKNADLPGLDLTGVFVGSEGTLGIVTAAILRILKMPETVKTMLAAFASLEDAGNVVSAIVAAGLIPATLEMMDNRTINAVEDALWPAAIPATPGRSCSSSSTGSATAWTTLAEQIAAICRANGALEVRVAQDEAERADPVERPAGHLRLDHPPGPQLHVAGRHRAPHHAPRDAPPGGRAGRELRSRGLLRAARR